jgi:hypothetical protein
MRLLSQTTMAIVLLPLIVQGQQNLVPNGSFEENEQCPSVPNQWTVSHWQTGNGLSPDYYHFCGDSPPVMVPTNLRGHQYPHSADAYVGIWAFSKQHPDARDYIQIELIQPLTPSIRYLVSFYCSLAEVYGGYAISTLGASLTEFPPIVVSTTTLLAAEPQVLNEPLNAITDTANWVLISDTVFSRYGGERYLTIGNFNSDGESDTTFFNPNAPVSAISYYYIDDVSVIALDSIPNSIADPATEPALTLTVWPNPATSLLHIRSGLPLARLRLLDLSGRALHAQEAQGTTHTIPLHTLPAGLYLLEAEDTAGRKAVQRVVKVTGAEE